MTFDYGDVKGEFLFRNGIHGFLNDTTKKVEFCGRTQHLDLIKNGYLDGVPDGHTLHRSLEEGGAQWGLRSTTYDDIYTWTAAQGWIHFISHKPKGGGDEMHFTTLYDTQDRLAKAFAREWGSLAVIDRHQDPRAIASFLEAFGSGNNDREAGPL